MDDYANAGVDVAKADQGISRIVERIIGTWPKAGGFGSVMLPVGYFANVIDIGNGLGLTITTDGVGSKTMLCEIMGKYDTIGQDCVAMNVNDLICVGARPLSLVDYIGVEKANPEILDQIGLGLVEGARQAGISITGGEVSQLPDIVWGFDLVGTAVGIVPLDRIITGADIQPRDVVIGIHSVGLHSNGYSLARKALFYDACIDPEKSLPELGHVPLGLEMLRPTPIYVRAIIDILDELPKTAIKALVNITGDGLLNLNRVAKTGVAFVLDNLPRPPEIFNVIRDYGQVYDEMTQFEVFNMGIGFCLVVSPTVTDRVISILDSCGHAASVIGIIEEAEENTVYIPHRLLMGKGKKFSRASDRDRTEN